MKSQVEEEQEEEQQKQEEPHEEQPHDLYNKQTPKYRKKPLNQIFNNYPKNKK